MYLSHFGFSRKPFSIIPDPETFYWSPKHHKALQYLLYGLAEGTGIILFTGRIGAGKTTLIRYLLNQVAPKQKVAVLFNTNLDKDDLIRMVLYEYGLEPSSSNKAGLLDQLNTFLLQEYAKGRCPLLIIDEAQNLPLDILEEIRMLSNLQTERDSLLQIMLVGQTNLRSKLHSPSFVQLSQRITASYHLGCLSNAETAEYIRHRLARAGARNLDIFDPDSIHEIHMASGGIPRAINILCDAALLYAFADDAQSVDQHLVQEVLHDREENGICNLIENLGVLQDNSPPDGKNGGDSPSPAQIAETCTQLSERIAKLESQYAIQEMKFNALMSQQNAIYKPWTLHWHKCGDAHEEVRGFASRFITMSDQRKKT